MDSWIELHNVGKWYTSREPILQQIDLTVHREQCLAIRGRNGSGKSTLLKIIAGLTKPSAGVVRRAPNMSVGYAPEQFPRVRFRAEEYLTHLGRIRRIPRVVLRRRIEELMDLFLLHAAGPILHYSKGMAQKVNLMQALLARPDVLVLDEPLSGLDAAAQADFTRLLLSFKREGTAIVVTGHEPNFAEAWADRIVAIQDGKLAEVRAGAEDAAEDAVEAAGSAEAASASTAAAEPSSWICDQWGVN